MSVSTVSSNSVYTQGSESGFHQRRSDFRQLVSAINSGDVNAIQQAYNQLESDLGTSANGNSTSSAASPFQTLLTKIGSALQSGSVSDAQQALADFRSQREQGNRPPPPSGGPGALMDAIFKSLEQAGATASSNAATTSSGGSTAASTSDATSTAASGQNPLQALGAFMHDLFTALQTQSGQSAATSSADSDGDGDNTASAALGAGHHHHHGGGGLGQVESNLQNLIQQLSSSSGSGSSTSTSTSNSTTSTLQQDYQNLLGALGMSSDSSSLTTFLQDLSQNLSQIGSSGSVVNTKA